MSQLIGSLAGVLVAVVGAAVVYGMIRAISGLRLSEEEEYNGADLSIHKIESTSQD